MRLYIIGPVSGVDQDNRPAFEAAALKLEKAGYDAYVPHWFIPAGTEWHQAMRRSIEMLVKCDGVAALDNFGASKGARLEAEIAAELDMPIKSVETWLRGAAAWKR